MKLKMFLLFLHINAMYHTQLYGRGDYIAKVRALHYLLKQEGIIK
jgi:hypothetical protein